MRFQPSPQSYGIARLNNAPGITSVDVIRMGASFLTAWVVGPQLLKERFPKWGYGKRALTSWVAVAAVNLAWNAAAGRKKR